MRLAMLSDTQADECPLETAPGVVHLELRPIESDIEAAARAIEASELPSEFGDQLREARGSA